MQPDPTADPWAHGAPEPTTLIALWPGDAAPTPGGVMAALRSRLPETPTVVGDAGSDDPRVTWSAVLAIPDRERPVILWSEPARELDPGELDDPAAAGCRWVLGAETLLAAEEPLGDFTALMRLLVATFGDVPAILDVNSGRWHPRRALERHFGTDRTPPEDVLWMTHVVVSAPNDQSAGAWLHTHGLQRCGRPELEMIEVPAGHADRAAELLSGLAGRMLEEGAPAPGEPFAVGPQLAVTLRPWQVVARDAADAPGSVADRAGMPGDAHCGVRAVVCGTEPHRDHPPTSWPREVLERLERGEGTLFLSRYETNRLAERAQGAWPQFTGAVATVSPQGLRVAPGEPADDDTAIRFLVKAGLSAGEPSSANAGAVPREHLWFAVRRCEADRFEGELLNQPAAVTTLQRGDVTWIPRHRVSDWSVVTPSGTFGPSDVDAMSGALEALAGEPEGPS